MNLKKLVIAGLATLSLAWLGFERYEAREVEKARQEYALVEKQREAVDSEINGKLKTEIEIGPGVYSIRTSFKDNISDSERGYLIGTNFRLSGESVSTRNNIFAHQDYQKDAYRAFLSSMAVLTVASGLSLQNKRKVKA